MEQFAKHWAIASITALAIFGAPGLQAGINQPTTFLANDVAALQASPAGKQEEQ
jgi:hypothetical protein